MSFPATPPRGALPRPPPGAPSTTLPSARGLRGRSPGRRNRPLSRPLWPRSTPSSLPERAFPTPGSRLRSQLPLARLSLSSSLRSAPREPPPHARKLRPSLVGSRLRSESRPIPARPSFLGWARPLGRVLPCSARAPPPRGLAHRALRRAAGGGPPLPRTLPPGPGRAPGRDGGGVRSPRGPVGVRKRPAPPPGHVRDPSPSPLPQLVALLDRAPLRFLALSYGGPYRLSRRPAARLGREELLSWLCRASLRSFLFLRPIWELGRPGSQRAGRVRGALGRKSAQPCQNTGVGNFAPWRWLSGANRESGASPPRTSRPNCLTSSVTRESRRPGSA